MKNWKENISFVLVEPREPGNIGASARAMKNMGFSRLALVNPPTLKDEAWWFACNALDVLGNAASCSSIPEAVADAALVAGTSRRKGGRRGLFMNVQEAALKLYEIAQDNRVALLFGREDRGLYNEEVDDCGFLITIPTDIAQPSLNLSQAVLIVAYELSRAEHRGKPSGEGRKLAEQAQIAALYDRVSEVLKILEYMPKGDNDLEKKIMQNLKHFIGRTGLTDWELRMFHGICSQIIKKVKQPTCLS